MLVKAFVKVHSNENISDNLRKYREQKVKENVHMKEESIRKEVRLKI